VGELLDKAEGGANDVTDRAKVAAGQRTDSLNMIIKGARQQKKCKA
jgi:uncharacterized protein YjbJ (UPF0337 family)